MVPPSNTPSFLPEKLDATTAWLFPGQGAQEVGMGHDLYEASPAARAVFDTADRVLGYSLTKVCFEGPEDKLRDTEFAQPAIFTMSLACLAAAVESGAVSARPAFVSGHSLGEYSALVAGGALTLEDGLSLLQQRARAMAKACVDQPGTLAAVIGLDEAAVDALCAEADVDVCNRNLPNQTVVGGTRESINRVLAIAKQRGIRAQELNVGGAFHSRLMRPAAAGLKAAIDKATISDPVVPLVGNASATALSTAQSVRDELAVQIASPVRWHESVTLMASAGVTRFIEFGPGRILTGLARRIVDGAELVNISGPIEGEVTSK